MFVLLFAVDVFPCFCVFVVFFVCCVRLLFYSFVPMCRLFVVVLLLVGVLGALFMFVCCYLFHWFAFVLLCYWFVFLFVCMFVLFVCGCAYLCLFVCVFCVVFFLCACCVCCFVCLLVVFVVA